MIKSFIAYTAAIALYLYTADKKKMRNNHDRLLKINPMLEFSSF